MDMDDQEQQMQNDPDADDGFDEPDVSAEGDDSELAERYSNGPPERPTS